MSKRYSTPHRTRTIKTRVTEEEHADFMERLTTYGMSQSEFIRQAITGATVNPIITVSPVNDGLLAAVGRLTKEYSKIGSNLNQIVRYLNEYGAPYNTLSSEIRAACPTRGLPHFFFELRRGELRHCLPAGQSPLWEKPAEGGRKESPLHHQL